jgi:hypothetical protein
MSGVRLQGGCIFYDDVEGVLKAIICAVLLFSCLKFYEYKNICVERRYGRRGGVLGA